MLPLVVTLIASCPPVLEARQALFDRDFVALARWRSISEEQPRCAKNVSAVEPLFELARFARCLPLETNADDPRHQLLELHADLLKLARSSQDFVQSEIETLARELRRERPLQSREGLVRWPLDGEIWSGEEPEPFVQPSACPDDVRGDAEELRARIHSMTLRLIDAPLPREVIGAIAYQAVNAATVRTSTTDLSRLDRALESALPSEQSAASLWLGTLFRPSDPERSRRLFERVLSNPARRPAEDLRARAGLAEIFTSNRPEQWTEVLQLGLGPEDLGPSDLRRFLVAQRSRALWASFKASNDPTWLDAIDGLVETSKPLLDGSVASNAIVDVFVARALTLSPVACVDWVQSRAVAGLDLENLAARALAALKLDVARVALQSLGERKKDASRPRLLMAELMFEARDLVGFNAVLLAITSDRSQVSGRRVREACLALAAKLSAAGDQARPFTQALISAEGRVGGPGQCVSLLAVVPTAGSIRHLGEIIVERQTSLPAPRSTELERPAPRLAIMFEDLEGKLQVGSPWKLN